MIIECGVHYKNILSALDYDLSNVVGCLISHEHKDHSKSIEKLKDYGIEIYCSLGTVKGIYEPQGICFVSYTINHIKAGKLFNIGTFRILPFNIHHDAKEPLGFLINHKEIGNLLFLTDTYYCDYNFKNLNHILVECNYSKEYLDSEDNLTLRNRIVSSHFELNNVIEFLKSNDLSNVKNILLLHISEKNGDKILFKELIEKNIGFPVQTAEKGVILDLNV